MLLGESVACLVDEPHDLLPLGLARLEPRRDMPPGNDETVPNAHRKSVPECNGKGRLGNHSRGVDCAKGTRRVSVHRVMARLIQLGDSRRWSAATSGSPTPQSTPKLSVSYDQRVDEHPLIHGGSSTVCGPPSFPVHPSSPSLDHEVSMRDDPITHAPPFAPGYQRRRSSFPPCFLAPGSGRPTRYMVTVGSVFRSHRRRSRILDTLNERLEALICECGIRGEVQAATLIQASLVRRGPSINSRRRARASSGTRQRTIPPARRPLGDARSSQVALPPPSAEGLAGTNFLGSPGCPEKPEA